jgi:hypothetical protein
MEALLLRNRFPEAVELGSTAVPRLRDCAVWQINLLRAQLDLARHALGTPAEDLWQYEGPRARWNRLVALWHTNPSAALEQVASLDYIEFFTAELGLRPHAADHGWYGAWCRSGRKLFAVEHIRREANVPAWLRDLEP